MYFFTLQDHYCPPTRSQADFVQAESVCLVLGSQGDALRFHIAQEERGQRVDEQGYWGHLLMRTWAAGGL